MKKMQLAVALGFVFAGVSYGQLVSGGGTAVDADPSIEVPIFETRQSIGGDVGGGREFSVFIGSLPAEGNIHDAVIAQNVMALYEDGILSSSSESFRVENFMSNRTMVAYFRVKAGTNETISGTDLKFTVSGTDSDNMWADLVGFTAAQGYSKETFIGERPDGQPYATGTPLTYPSKVIVGAIKFKYLSASASQDTRDWFIWYVNSFPGLVLKMETEIKGTAYPAVTLHKAPPGLRVTKVNGQIHVVAEVVTSDTGNYMLQSSVDLRVWQDIKRLAQGGTAHFTVGTEPAKFFRLIHKP